MKKWLLAALFGVVLTLGACGGGGDDAADNGDNGDAGATDNAAAEEVYKDNCASCHGADLSGGAGPDLTSVGADYSKDEIVDIIQNGKGQMPAQNLSDDDADLIAGWLAEKQ